MSQLPSHLQGSVDFSVELENVVQSNFNDTPVKHVCLIRIEASGNLRGLVCLVNSQEFLEFHHSMGIFDRYGDQIKEIRKTGFTLTDHRPDFEEMLRRVGEIFAFRKEFNLGYELEYLLPAERPNPDARHVVWFMSNRYDDDAPDFYLNNLDRLRGFSHAFVQKYGSALQEIEPVRIKDFVPPEHLFGVDKIRLEQWSFLERSPKYRRMTQRQREILHWYLEGKTSEETAIILGITRSTCLTHSKRMLKKFDVKTKAQLVAEVFREAHLFGDTDLILPSIK